MLLTACSISCQPQAAEQPPGPGPAAPDLRGPGPNYLSPLEEASLRTDSAVLVRQIRTLATASLALAADPRWRRHVYHLADSIANSDEGADWLVSLATVLTRLPAADRAACRRAMQRAVLRQGGTPADTAALPALLGAFWAGHHTVVLRSYLRLSAVPDSGHVDPPAGAFTVFAPQLAPEDATPAWTLRPTGQIQPFRAPWDTLDLQPGWRVNLLVEGRRSSIFLYAARRPGEPLDWQSGNIL